MKKAIVTGIAGQDGYYMGELLKNEGYKVLGLIHDIPIDSDVSSISARKVDFARYKDLEEVIKTERPDEIYNFAGQSSSIGSWDNTVETCELNFLAPITILQSIRDYAPKCRFFQASSAEIFGKEPAEIPQNEKTRAKPETPYAVTKFSTEMMIDCYRKHYGIYAVNGIFYNHESIRRKDVFLPSKIARTVADIKLGNKECLYVGNVESQRDWGYAPDYMYAAWKCMQLEKPNDYIFATGVLHSVKYMIEVAFASVSMPLQWEGEGVETKGYLQGTNRILVRVDKRFYREYDRCNSVGNPDKLYNAIGWKPETTFEEMIGSMTNYFLN